MSDRLSESEEQAWRSWIMATRKLYAHLGQEIQDEFGLPMGDYEILVRLSEGPDQRLRMSELAKITQASGRLQGLSAQFGSLASPAPTQE